MIINRLWAWMMTLMAVALWVIDVIRLFVPFGSPGKTDGVLYAVVAALMWREIHRSEKDDAEAPRMAGAPKR